MPSVTAHALSQPVPATVFVVDDEPSWGKALGRLLRNEGFAVEIFTDASAFLETCRPETPGCLLLDLNMPGMDGLKLQESMQARALHLPIIFISGDSNVPKAVSAMRAGAIDFLEKPFDNDALIGRVRAAIATDAEARARRARQIDARERLSRLTPRERQVLELLVTGQSNKQIAQVLGASNRTIDVHRARLMDKMEAGSLPELVKMALDGAASD